MSVAFRGFMVAVGVALFGAGQASAAAWRLERERDPFSDRQNVRAVYSSGDGVALAVRCHGGALDALLIAGYVGEADASVRFRFDDGEVQSNVWDALSERDGLWSPSPGNFARQLMSGSRLVFEYTNYAGSARRYQVGLSGSAGPVGAVLDACGVPRTDPRAEDAGIWRRAVDDLDKVPREGVSTIQQALVAIGGQNAGKTGVRDLATYRALSDFYEAYWEDCEAGRLIAAACDRWRQLRRYDVDADYPVQPIELLAEVFEAKSREAAQLASPQDEHGRPLIGWSTPPRLEMPERAAERGAEGAVELQCSVSLGGGLQNCSVIREDPPGLGFGRAALSATRLARVGPLANMGDLVVFTVAFPPKGEQPDAALLR